jgi:hypothetical protein
VPRLVLRAKRPNPTSCILDCFVLFGTSFLPRRSTVAVRWRLDEHEPERAEWNNSTSKDALFPSGSFDELIYLIFRISASQQFIFETEQKDGSRCACHFQLANARGELSNMLLACQIADPEVLVTLRPGLVNYVLRIGPKNTVLVKTALKAAGVYTGPVDAAKGRLLYESVGAFAQSAHVSEVFGDSEERKGFLGLSTKRQANLPFLIAVQNRAPRKVQEEMGPLKIFD